jgi:hypothetical protein
MGLDTVSSSTPFSPLLRSPSGEDLSDRLPSLPGAGQTKGGALFAQAPARSPTAQRAIALTVDPRDPNKLAAQPGRVVTNIFSGIENGARKDTHAIVLHMTGGSAAGTLQKYGGNNPTGATFLIKKDGTIIQTANMDQKTSHVGALRPKGYMPIDSMRNRRIDADLTPASKAIIGQMEAGKLPFGSGVKRLAALEAAKSYGNDRHDESTRLPMNSDSIGIEFEANETNGQYDALTNAQKAAGHALVELLQAKYALTDADVYEHPDVSYKTYSEARGAWEAIKDFSP